MNRTYLTTLLLGLTTQEALANGYSTDTELIHPTFSQGSFYGVDSPWLAPGGTIRLGTAMQYEDDPLILVKKDGPVSIIGTRVAWHLGAQFGLSDKFSIAIVLPTAVSWGADQTSFSHEGASFGDLRAQGVLAFYDQGAVTLGTKLGFALPTSTDEAYFGETNSRVDFGLLAAAELGSWDVLSELSVTGRSRVETEEDFSLGSELGLKAGVRRFIYEEKIALQAALHSRSGFSNLFGGGAENATGFLAGFHVRPSHLIQLNLGGGSGISEGYGTTDLRAMASIQFIAKEVIREELPDSDRKDFDITFMDPAPDISDIIANDLPEPDPITVIWKEHELARVKEDRILIRQSIQFEVGTEDILPSSLPTLKAVGELMGKEARIGHLVIEGHASEEGTYESNFDLSNRRARAVFRAIVRYGVHPARLSYRGMGEVVPAAGRSAISVLEASRRVEFKIVAQLHTGDDFPNYPEKILLPWSGEAGVIVNPDQPVRKAPEVEEIDKPTKQSFEYSEEEVLIEGTEEQ